MDVQTHRYSASVDNLTAALNASAFDLILIAPAAGVPIYVHEVVMTAAQTAAAIQRAFITRRSTASTGGTAVTPAPDSPASPAASTVITYNNVTTTGAVSGTPFGAQEWNQFAPYQFNKNPGGILVVPGTWLAVCLPATPAAFSASFYVDFSEVK